MHGPDGNEASHFCSFSKVFTFCLNVFYNVGSNQKFNHKLGGPFQYQEIAKIEV
jgi:hypothetical protein